MSYVRASSLPPASSRRNMYEVLYEPRARNDTDNTYEQYGERFDVYGRQLENDEPISRRQQGFNCFFFFFNSFELL